MNERLTWISALAPRTSPEEIVTHLNRIYHKYEAAVFDRQHPELTEQLPEVWSRLLQAASPPPGEPPRQVLDFGCGTGFEALQLLETIEPGSLRLLVCYDLSAEMLARCREKLSRFEAPLKFTTSLDEVLEFAQARCFDLVVTNSLLHHLPDWRATARLFRDLLAPGGFWINGHEPSVSFYRNSECRTVLEDYRRWRRWRKFLDARAWVRRVSTLLGITPNLARLTAREFNSLGLTSLPVPERMVTLLVDLNVPHNEREAESVGLNPTQMAEELARDFDQAFLETYSYMGPFYEGRLPRRWRSRAQDLRLRFPTDGAEFAAVWRRKRG